MERKPKKTPSEELQEDLEPLTIHPTEYDESDDIEAGKRIKWKI